MSMMYVCNIIMVAKGNIWNNLTEGDNLSYWYKQPNTDFVLSHESDVLILQGPHMTTLPVM